MKKNFKKEIVLALIFLLILIGAFSLMGLIDNQTIEGRDGLEYAKTIQDIDQYFYEKIPGLKRAEREGNVQYIDQEIEFPNYRGSLIIDKVWYTSNQVFVFYHVIGDIPDNVNASLIGEDKSLYSYPYFYRDSIGGIVYKDGFYNVAYFGNYTNKGHIKQSETFTIKFNLYYLAETSDRVSDTLVQPKGMTKETESKGVSLQYSDLIIETNLDKEMVHTLNIDEEFSLGDHGKINLNQLILEPQISYITFEFINNDGYKLEYLVGNIKTDKNESKSVVYFDIPGEKNVDGMIYFDVLEENPTEIELEILALSIMSDKQIDFKIPVEQYHGKLTDPMTVEKLNQKIGSIKGTDIILEQLIIDNTGINLTIYQDTGIDSSHMINSYFQGFRINTNDYQKLVDEDLPNVITFTNDKGDEAETNAVGDIGIGLGDKFNMYIYKEYVEASETINVTIDNLTYKVVGEWKGKFILSK